MLTRSGWLLLVGAALVLVAARVFGIAELFTLGAIGLALPVVALAWLRRPLPVLHAERLVTPRRVHLGAPSRVELQVTNLGRRRTPVLTLHDPVAGTIGARVAVAPLVVGERHDAGYRLPTDRRGLLHIGPLHADLTDPLGLARRRLPVADGATLTVLPAIEALAPVPLGGGRDEPLAGQVRRALGTVADDFATLRPYVVGDDLRRIHWPSTARAGDLLVRQDDARWQGHVTVVLDNRRERIEPDAFEAAVSAAASLVHAVGRSGDRVRLILADGTDTGLVDARRAGDLLLEHLAVVQPADVGALPASLGPDHQRGTLVVVTGRTGDPDLESLVGLAAPGTAAVVAVAATWSPLPGPVGIAPVVAVDRTRPLPSAWAAAVDQLVRRRA